MFSQNILNIGIDGMLLAIPEIFIFCSTLILMILDIFFFKEKSFKNTNKFGIFIIIISFFLTLLLPSNGIAFNELYFVSEFSAFFKLIILFSIFCFVAVFNKSDLKELNFQNLIPFITLNLWNVNLSFF